MSNTSTPKKRRPMTAARRFQVVRDAVNSTGVASTDTVEVLLAKLKDAALEEVIGS